MLTRLKYAAFQLGFTPSSILELASRLRLGIVDNTTNRIKQEMSESQHTTAIQRVFLSWSDVDWTRTKAYALGGNFTGFYINGFPAFECNILVNEGEEKINTEVHHPHFAIFDFIIERNHTVIIVKGDIEQSLHKSSFACLAGCNDGGAPGF